MSDDSGMPPTADEAAQQEADKIDHALEQLSDVQDTIAEIAEDFTARRDELTADEVLAEPTLPVPDGVVPLPLGKVVGSIAPAAVDEDAGEIEDGGLATEPVSRAKDPLQMPVIPQTNVPFPYDVNAVHRCDNLAKGSRIEVVLGGEQIEQVGAGVYGQSLPMGDVVEHFPIGTEILYGEGDARVMLVLRATPLRAPVITVGPGLHYAAAQMWPWLVTEGHAKVAL